MRKGLAVVATVASLGLAGCSGGPESGQAPPAPPAPPQPAKAVRQGPTKNINVTDQCSVIPPDKAKQLGYDRPPYPRNSAGMNGCQYDAQEAGSPEGWGTFTAVIPQPMQEWAQRTPKGKPDVVAGYPAHAIDDGASCMIWVDVSDHGSVFAHTITRPGTQRAKTEPCRDVAKPAAEAMIQNLPNA